MHNLSVYLWDLRTIPLWSKWTKDLTLYCLNKIKEIMILLLQNSSKPVRQTILLIGIIWWVQFQSSNKVSNNTWIYVYIKKTWQNFNSNSNSNSREFQLQFQLREFQLQLQLRPISRISTPTPNPGVSTPTPTPATLLNINSNSNSGGFNSNSNSNSGVGVGVEPNSNSNSGVDPNPVSQFIDLMFHAYIYSKSITHDTKGRLSKAYDVTIPLYRKSRRKIKVSKMHILW